MDNYEKAKSKLNVTKAANKEIERIAEEKQGDKNRVLAAKEMLTYYLGDIKRLLRKEKHSADDALLLIIKANMCMDAIRYLLSLKQGNEYLGLLTESQKASIKRFRSLRSIATAHPFNTSNGGEENFGRRGTEWFVDIRPYGWCDDFLSESSYGFCEDESFSCSEKPDFVMIVYSANNDSRHRRKIYIYKDIIEPLIMSVEFLNKEIKKQNHGTVTPDT